MRATGVAQSVSNPNRNAHDPAAAMWRRVNPQSLRLQCIRMRWTKYTLRGSILTLLAVGAVLATACGGPAEVEGEFGAAPAVQAKLFAGSEISARESLEAAESNLARARSTFDREGDPAASELARLNARAADGFYQVNSTDLYRALLLTLDWAKASEGAFDPTVGPLIRLYTRENQRLPSPNEVSITLDRMGWARVTIAQEAQAVRFQLPGMALDLGRVGQAYALDTAGRGLAQGAQAALLASDGLAYAWNAPPNSEGWSVELPNPRGGSLGQVIVRSRGVAVAGNGVGGTIRSFDPRSGQPASSDLAAAVAIADTTADAAALAESVYVLGSTAGGDLLTRSRRVEAVMLVTGNGPAYLLASASLQGRLTLSPEIEAQVEGRVRYLLPPAQTPRS